MSRYIITIAVAGFVFGAGCERERRTTNTPAEDTTATAQRPAAAEQAYVRFINADQTRQKLDLYFGDQPVFSDVGYRQVTTFRMVPTERAQFKARIPGSTSDLATNSEGLWANQGYTIIAMPDENGGTTLYAMSDKLEAPPSGKAKVRIINASKNVGDVDLWVPGTKTELIDGVDPNSVSDFEDAQPSTAGVEIRRDDRKGNPVKISDTPIEAGKLYTVLLTGDRNQLQGHVIEERGAGNSTMANP